MSRSTPDFLHENDLIGTSAQLGCLHQSCRERMMHSSNESSLRVIVHGSSNVWPQAALTFCGLVIRRIVRWWFGCLGRWRLLVHQMRLRFIQESFPVGCLEGHVRRWRLVGRMRKRARIPARTGGDRIMVFLSTKLDDLDEPRGLPLSGPCTRQIPERWSCAHVFNGGSQCLANICAERCSTRPTEI